MHRHVQQAALLEAVVATVVVADVADRPARQQRVAVLAVARDGVGPVGRRRSPRAPGIPPAPLGPAEPVRSKRRASRRWTARTSCRNTMSASSASTPRPRLWISSRLRGPDAAHALVDVVGGHAQHAVGRRRRQRSSCESRRVHVMPGEAWQLQDRLGVADGEKQRSAASRHGSQAWRRCSRGFSVTGDAARHAQAEHVLGVVRHAGRVAVAPDRVDLVDVSRPQSRSARAARRRLPISMPVSSATSRTQVSTSGSSGGPSSRSPSASSRAVGALDQQHLERRACGSRPAPTRES